MKKDVRQQPASAPAPIVRGEKSDLPSEGPDGRRGLSCEEAECLDYFSHTSLTDSRFATAGRVRTRAAVIRDVRPPESEEPAELTVLKESEARLVAEVGKLRQLLAAAESRVGAAELERDAHVACLKSEEARRKRLEDEVRNLRERLTEAERAADTPVSPVLSEPSVRSAEKGVLAVPTDLVEAFPGETREMVVAALQDACQTARQGARERRAAVLESVLAANPSSGELERRRTELRQIVKNAGYTNDEQMLKALARLGLRLVSGRKHWKLEYGNVRIPLSKTPSDFRSNLNASADIANRCF